MPSRAPVELAGIAPFFIVADVNRSAAFYREVLGFSVVALLPDVDPFFGIVRRGKAQIFIKAVGDGVEPLPNPRRHIHARLDAFVDVFDPDALAAELAARGTRLLLPLSDTEDGLRGFEVQDCDGHVLFFGCRREEARSLRAASTPAAYVASVQPVLMVRNVVVSLSFYEKLGFQRAFQDSAENPTYAGVRRGGAELHLQWHDSSAWAQAGDRPTYRFVVADVDELLLELRASGPLDINELGNTPWGTREFHVRDPDGNGLQFYRDLF
jgi:catechol 2,3-dioxygenase-like lactoylglutathione lyase family enzyme